MGISTENFKNSPYKNINTCVFNNYTEVEVAN